MEIRKVVKKVIDFLFYPVVVLLVILSVLIYGIGPYKAYLITGGSMSPTYNFGDYAIIQEAGNEQVETGDVVLMKGNNEFPLVLHRVVSIEKACVLTQGDANHTLDPEGCQEIVGISRARIPIIGIPLYFINRGFQQILGGL